MLNPSSLSPAPIQRIGAYPLGPGRYRFRVWGPLLQQMELKVLSPIEQQLLMQPEQGGYGIDAQWCDDFHHCVHTLLTGEKEGYYEDFGQLEQLAKSY